GFIVPVPNRGEAGASSLGVHGRESPASRSFLSRGSGGGWQRQWRAWSAPALPRELLCSFRHWSGRAQHRSGLPPTRGLTPSTRTSPSVKPHRVKVNRESDSRGVIHSSLVFNCTVGIDVALNSGKGCGLEKLQPV